MSTPETPRRKMRTATALAGAVLAGSSLLGAAGCASPWATGPAAETGGTGSEWGGYLESPQLCFPADGEVTSQRLIEGYRELVRAARDHGIKPVGATIVPLRGLQFPYDQDAAEQVRVDVNEWIRTSGEFDSVIDFDRVMADPARPGLPRPGYVYDDSLHLNDTGYHAIANSIDLDQL